MNQLSLPVEIDPPPRPCRFEKSLMLEVAEKLALDVGDDASAEEIAEAMNDSSSLDGYEIARFLESNYCWDVDADTVATLDGATSMLFFAHREKVAQWVKRFNVTVPFAVGQRVVADSGERGVIRRVDPEHAECTVAIDGKKAEGGYVGSLFAVERLKEEING